MKVLAIIVTCRRPDWLIRCIQSVLEAAKSANGAGHWLELGIRVGINGKDPQTLKALNELIASLPAPHLIQVQQLEDGLTPGKARNRLLEEDPKTDWLYFIDDDAFVDEGIFTRFRKVVLDNPRAGVIGGPNLTPSGSSPFQRNLGAALSSRFATFKTVDRYLAFGQSRSCGEESLILCNLFVRQSALPRDPFPVDLRCGEENHLLRKLSSLGVELVHSPELSVSHERRDSLPKLISQVIHYGISRGQSMVHESRARHWAYALPSLCIITAVLLSAKWILGFGPSPTLVVLTTLYVLLSFIAAIRVRASGTSILSIALLFFWIHFSYGVGVIVGIARPLKLLASGSHRGKSEKLAVSRCD